VPHVEPCPKCGHTPTKSDDLGYLSCEACGWDMIRDGYEPAIPLWPQVSSDDEETRGSHPPSPPKQPEKSSMVKRNIPRDSAPEGYFMETDGKIYHPRIPNSELIIPQRTDFLLNDKRFPLGKLVAISGRPGVGKSLIAMNLAAAVSRGFAFPYVINQGRKVTDERDVIYFSAEDGVEDTLIQRAGTLDASVGYIHFNPYLEEDSDEEGVKLRTTLQNLKFLRFLLEHIRPALMIFDCMDSYLGKTVDANQSNHVRQVLDPLGDLAQEYKCTMLLLRHFGKGKKDNVGDRALGSVGITGALRSELHIDFNPEDEEDDPNHRQYILAHSKANLSAKMPSLAYRVVSSEAWYKDECFPTSRIQWLGESVVTAEDLNHPPERSQEEKSARIEAKDFLYACLADGPVESKLVIKEAKAAGISQRTLERARSDVGVQPLRIGDKWMMQLGKSPTL